MGIDKLRAEIKRRNNEVFDTKIKSTWYDPEDPLEFVSVAYQRAISMNHVNKIVKYLKKERQEGKTPLFSEPIVVNVRESGKLALLDGYHRIEALKKFNDKVKIKLELYDSLTYEQEKRIYTDYNIGKTHSVLDLLRPDVHKNKAIKELMDNSWIPLTLYVNRKKGLPLSAFLSCYLNVKKVMHGGETKPLKEYVFEDFGVSDARKLVDFTEWYTKVVGEYAYKSDFFHKGFLTVIMFIYWNTLRLDVLESRLRTFVFDAEMRQVLNSVSGFSGFNLICPAVKERINKGLKRPII